MNEKLEVNLENIDITGKSHARRNLLSVLVDADITLDSNLRICCLAVRARCVNEFHQNDDPNMRLFFTEFWSSLAEFSDQHETFQRE